MIWALILLPLVAGLVALRMRADRLRRAWLVAIAAIHAGVQTPVFQNLMRLLTRTKE